jgi:hypothetical protein
MARKRYTPEQVVSVLRQVEVLAANGKQTWHRVSSLWKTQTSSYRVAEQIVIDNFALGERAGSFDN